MPVWVANSMYLVASVLFIWGLKDLSHIKKARSGNFLSAVGMLIAIVVTLWNKQILTYQWILAGIVIGSAAGALFAYTVKMTAMPQMVALLNGFGGAASALVATSEFLRSGSQSPAFTMTAIALSIFVGAITFTGSLIAFGKLQGICPQQPVTYPLQKTLNLIFTLICLGATVLIVFRQYELLAYWVLAGCSLLLGVLLVLPIGGADMPVVISLLNSYSGIAAAMTGFVLMNEMLIVAGSLVGASGIILTQIMCRAMNRSLANVAFGTFGKVDASKTGKGAAKDYQGVKSCSSEEAAMLLENANQVIVVPGYGMAVAHAQHALQELASLLESKGGVVKYGIHPVAGRMPGHMNVLLAEANVPYEKVFEMDQVNNEFDQTDVALVIGANDVTNPAARNEKGSPIYGMPILNVDKAKSVIIIKRSLSPGFAGIKNPLFEKENATLLYADAKQALEQIIKDIKESA